MLLRSIATAIAFLSSCNVFAADSLEAVIGYLEKQVPPPPTLSNLDPVPDDEGLGGFQVGMKDNATTGKFLNHSYRAEVSIVSDGDDLVGAAKKLFAITSILVIKAPATDLLAIADMPEAQGKLIANASATEVVLRDGACRSNVLHSIPSRAMLSDALAQFSLKKRWTKWVMIQGARSGDKAMAEAYKRSAAKFRLKLLASKPWIFDADMRRSAAKEVPLFTQDFPEHDLLIVADESADFARYIPFHTWLPRPIAGSEGLVPSAWSAVVEQYGAAQLQSRFLTARKRKMRPVDYAAWAAVRVYGEAITRTNSINPQSLRNYILSDKFELGGFKGRKLTFRSWNGQLRQPIPLAHAGAVASLAPLEGFLHQRNELDTLGLDKPESKCEKFGG